MKAGTWTRWLAIVIIRMHASAVAGAQTLSPVPPADLNYYSYSTQAAPIPPSPAIVQLSFPNQSVGAQDSVTNCATYSALQYNHFTYDGASWTGPITGPVYRYFTNYYATIGNPGRDFPMNAWAGLSFDAAFDGKIQANSSPSTQTFIQSIFYHQSQCYEWGNEFGFYKLLQNPGNATENGTIYFYYSQNPNCYNVASLGSCRDKTSGASLVATTVSVPLAAPGLNSRGGSNWIYRAYLTSATNWRIRIVDPYAGSDFMPPVDSAIDPAGFYASTATTMFTSGQTGYISAVQQRNSILGGITNSMTNPLKLTIYSLAQILVAGALPAFSMERAQGWCELGGRTVKTGNVNSVTVVQQSFPLCTVTVYDATTGLLASLYSTNTSTPTPLPNPFSADANGHWYFYASNGRYNIQTAGGGGGGGGGGGTGTVTSVTFPTAPSWLTAAVATPTTTPAISLTPATGQTSHLVIGTCGSATTFAPCALTLADLPGGGGVTPHNLLSVTHPDTTPSSPVRGGGIFAIGASPLWTQVAHGSSGSYFKWNGTDIVASTGAASGTGACTNQAVTVLNSDAGPTCTTLTSAYADTSIAQTGVDMNTSFQVTATHLALAMPTNQGGSGTTATLTGILRGGSPFTASELSGDCVTSGSNAVTCSGLVKINAANTAGASMTLDMSAGISFRVPNTAGASTTTAGAMIFDSTNKGLHIGANGVDNLAGLLPTAITPANNDCVKFTVLGGVTTLNTAGGSCGVGGGVNAGTATHFPYYAASGATLTDLGADLTFDGTHTFTTSAAAILNLRLSSINGLTVNPTAASINEGFHVAQTGPVSGNQNQQINFNDITISSDQANTGAAGNVAYGMLVNYTFGGSNMQGSRAAIQGSVTLGAPSNAANPNRSYIGVIGTSLATSDGGTNTGAGAQGGFFGGNFVVQGSGQNVGAVIGLENDVGLTAPGSVRFRFGGHMVATGTVQGAGGDAALDIASGASNISGSWANGILLNDVGGTAPINTSGCILCTTGDAYTVATGVDFSTYTVSGNSLKLPGSFIVAGSGVTTIAGNTIHGSTGTPDSALEIRKSTGSAATVTPPTGTVLHVSAADGSSSTFLVDSFANSATFLFRRADNTVASPSALQSNDLFGYIGGVGYGTNAYSSTRSGIALAAAENWTNSAQGSQILLQTTPAGGTTLTTAIIVGSGGGLTLQESGGHLAFGGGKGQHIFTQAANNDITGTITISNPAISGSVSFTTAYNSAPACTITPTTNQIATVVTWWVTTSTTAVTANVQTTPASSINFFYSCHGNPN